MFKWISQWIRDRLFSRPLPPVVDIENQRKIENSIDEWEREARNLRMELSRVKDRAQEKGTDPLAELIKSMQRGRRKERGVRNH